MRSAALAGAISLVALTACSSAAQPAPARSAAPAPDVVATVGSASITLAELDELALKDNTSNYGAMRLLHALYEARRTALDELVAMKLVEQEAKARGTTTDALMTAEVSAKANAAVTDEEIAAWYNSHPDR